MADVVIIGAGAAGLFCAGWAVRAGHRVTVLEHMPSPGRKLLIAIPIAARNTEMHEMVKRACFSTSLAASSLLAPIS